jgi:hypothetical protein
MPLLQLWSSSSDAVEQFTVEQVVATAGDGNLKDESVCSQEFRAFLSHVSTSKLRVYVEHCLASGFNKSGMILQDLVNQLGRRLDYAVTNGRYQGTVSTIGFDGIWLSPEGHAIVVEVKTTDTYRISLDTIALYRKKLVDTGQIVGTSSMLIVVGRQDTGDLEAQVRGSRHAWDIRLISAEALLKLVSLKQAAEGPETGRKIRSLLIPTEYTRLDGMIDVMFTAARDVEEGAVEVATTDQDPQTEAQQDEQSDKATKSGWQFTDGSLLQAKRDDLVSAIGKRQGVTLIKESRALYSAAAEKLAVVCTLSKRYNNRSYPYWYAYHPHWHGFLQRAEIGLFVLGCMDLDIGFAIPVSLMTSAMDDLNTTVRPSGERYWHIHLTEFDGGYGLLLPKKSQVLPLTPYIVNL